MFNLKNLAASLEERKGEKGFTLIELIIVIAIIGILVAIAIPVYGKIQASARTQTVNSAAQNGLTAGSAALDDDDAGTTLSTAAASVTNSKVAVTFSGTTDSTLCATASWVNTADAVSPAKAGTCTP